MRKLTAACMMVSLLIAATVYPMAQNAYDSANANKSYKKSALSLGDATGTFDAKFLSHRLIKFDEESGLATVEKASKAYGNTEAYFNSTRRDCASNLSNVRFLACANKLLGKSFYYTPVAAVSKGWSARFSDCDLNVYLLMDAMHIAGKEAEIVYAPHHAFVAYRDEQTGQIAYWETTDNHNSGKLADLQESFYLKTPSHFYYQPQPFSYAEKLYPALVIDEIKSLQRRDALRQFLNMNFADNPIVQDSWYENKKHITREDAQTLLFLLKTDITSVSKRILLAKYLNTHNQQDKAQFFLSQITDDNCNDACLTLKSQYSFKYSFAHWSLKYVSLSLPDFFKSIRQSLKFYLLIFVCSVLYTVNLKVTLQICKRKVHSLPLHPDRRVE
ncbi:MULTISPECIES: hypothetical protein [Rahnella]|uniref:hypothetical protein n=1 Tax=Rahnella sp. GSA61A TaxID=2862678 RepID=UPI001CBDCF01|nr:hypothetical protein [Rahnella sp. GSA61A]